MTKRLLIALFFSVTGAAIAPSEIGAQNECEQCDQIGDLHKFLGNPNLCDLPDPPEDCFKCIWMPREHPGCHGDEEEGECSDHEECSAGEEQQELLLAIAHSDVSAISALIVGLQGKALVNYDRSAIQVRCGERLVAHLLLPSALLPRVQKALGTKRPATR